MVKSIENSSGYGGQIDWKSKRKVNLKSSTWGVQIFFWKKNHSMKIRPRRSSRRTDSIAAIVIHKDRFHYNSYVTDITLHIVHLSTYYYYYSSYLYHLIEKYTFLFKKIFVCSIARLCVEIIFDSVILMMIFNLVFNF